MKHSGALSPQSDVNFVSSDTVEITGLLVLKGTFVLGVVVVFGVVDVVDATFDTVSVSLFLQSLQVDLQF